MTSTRLIFGDEYWNRIESGPRGMHLDECVVCGRPCKGHAMFVNLDGGPEDIGSDMGWHPIGSECAKRARKAGWEVQTSEEMDR